MNIHSLGRTSILILVLAFFGTPCAASRTWNALIKGDTVVIEVVGSSRTDSNSARWPRLLTSSIISRFPGQVFLENKGLGGTQFEAINSRFLTCLSALKPPSAIFFEVFMDEAHPSDLKNYPDEFAYFRDHLRKAVTKGKAFAPKCDIILWLPFRLCKSCFIPDQQKLIDIAKEVAVAENVLIADNWMNFEKICSKPCCQKYNYYSHDGNHTTLAGDTLVAMEALRALRD
jgi:hypothetical protein